MSDAECVRFLQWALPRLRMRWPGFRKVRRQVCKRVERRRRELGLPDGDAYRAYLESHPDEWPVLDRLTHITISRFYRDKGVFEFMETDLLPALAGAAVERGAGALEAWSAGCGSGEEPYTVALVWELSLAERLPGVRVSILATDLDEAMIDRARDACYPVSSLKHLPEGWREAAFRPEGERYCLREGFKRPVTLERHDVRSGAPDGPFDLILCRNLAFTYFDLDLQREVCARLAQSLRPGGALVIGTHEALPENDARLEPWSESLGVYRRPREDRT